MENVTVKKVRKVNPVDPNKPLESKEARFKRLANRRLARYVSLCKQLSNLANQQQYHYTEEQRDTVCDIVATSARRIVDAFNQVSPPAGHIFV